MPKWIKRQKLILKLAGNKVSNAAYDLERSEEYGELLSQDRIKLKKLLAICASAQDRKKYVEKIRKNQDVILQRINYFLLKLIDKEVIPIKDINSELKGNLFTFLNNHSDAMTLASGIQYHQTEAVLIMTGDKKDWNKNNLQWVYDSRPDLAKKYDKIPEIRYIQDISL